MKKIELSYLRSVCLHNVFLSDLVYKYCHQCDKSQIFGFYRIDCFVANFVFNPAKMFKLIRFFSFFKDCITTTCLEPRLSVVRDMPNYTKTSKGGFGMRITGLNFFHFLFRLSIVVSLLKARSGAQLRAFNKLRQFIQINFDEFAFVKLSDYNLDYYEWANILSVRWNLRANNVANSKYSFKYFSYISFLFLKIGVRESKSKVKHKNALYNQKR